MKDLARVEMIISLLWLIALLSAACGLIKARGLHGINFDTIVFVSSWTQSGKVQLVNGEYREAATPGSASETVVKLTDHIASGQLDGKDAAAVVLVTDSGGSGTFYDLALLIKGPEGWMNRDVAFLGDRIKIHSLAMENEEIVVDMTTHGPGDNMCCPTRHAVHRFMLKGDRLMETSGETRRTADQTRIGTTTWKWQQTLYNNDTKAVPSNPDHYTLELLPDGRISIRADCNAGGGVYRLDGSRISIDIIHTTRAACPAGSLEDRYIRDLNSAAIYFMKDNALYIDLKYDTGTMKFSR